MDSPKYADFDVSSVPYKTINSHDIQAFALVPKNLKEGKYPIMAKFHGGFFVTGASLYPDWFPQWALSYSLVNSALIIAADYRLLPESTGADIFSDIDDFWTWIRNGNLQTHLSKVKPGIEADLSKVIAYGESAGGALAIQSGFVQFGFVKAVIATYPALELGSTRTEPIMGMPAIPVSVLEEFLKTREKGKVVSSANPPERMNIALSLAQQGRFMEFFREDVWLPVMSSFENSEDRPFVLILHGRDDSAVPVGGSERFVEVVKAKFGDYGRIDLRIQPGEHGFDKDATLDMPWLKEGLIKVTELWLRQQETK